MATAEELLQNAAETLSESVAEVCVIDEETRTINVPPGESLFGVTGDKDVERKYFQCPKIVGDNIDLSQHQIYIVYAFTSTQNSTVFPSVGINKYHCKDVKVSGDNITFSWKLSGNVLATPGFIAFKVMAAKNEGSNLKTKWNTAPAFGTVLITVPDGEEIAEEYPDIINQLFEEMEKVQEIATPEAMKGYVEAYMQEHPVTGGMTEEQEQQLNQNTQDVADLKSALPDKLDTNQGAENKGKSMVVGEDGEIVPGTIKVEEKSITPEKTDFLITHTNTYYVSDESVEEKRINLLNRETETAGKTLNSSTGNLQNNNSSITCDYIEIEPGETYCLQYVSPNSYVGVSERIQYYDNSKNILINHQPSYQSQIGLSVCVAQAPHNAYYARAAYPVGTTDLMFSKGATVGKYVEYNKDFGEDEDNETVKSFTVYSANDSLKQAVKNIDLTEYSLSDYMIEDPDGVATLTDNFSRNGKQSYKIIPKSTSGNTVIFRGFTLYPQNDYIGIWLYASRKDIGPTSGGNLTFEVKLNKNVIGTFSRHNMTAGFQYLQIKVDKITFPITIFEVTVKYTDISNIPSLYVTSIGTGKLHKIPFVLWTNDCTAKNFYEKGYPLFKKYGIPANFDYYPGSLNGEGTSWDDAAEALYHFDMISDNMGYGVYSYTGTYQWSSPVDYANGAEWDGFAERLWKTGNDWGIFAPNMVQSANHNVGAAYDEAMKKVGFPIIRHAQATGATVAYFDPETREFPCNGLEGGWSDPDSVLTTFKGYIQNAIDRGADVMIINHSVLDDDDSTGLNISTEAITLCLEYLSELHKAGIVYAASVEEFLISRSPELYVKWQKQKQSEEQKYYLTKQSF